MTPLNPSKRVETAKNACRTMGTLCSKRVDKLETMCFGHFKHTVQHYMTSNGFLAKKNFGWFRTFFKILNRRLEVDIDSTVSNGVPLELY